MVDTATRLMTSTVMMMLRRLSLSAAIPPTRTKSHQADACARRDEGQRSRIIVQRDDLQRGHDRPHALGEDGQ